MLADHVNPLISIAATETEFVFSLPVTLPMWHRIRSQPGQRIPYN